MRSCKTLALGLVCATLSAHARAAGGTITDQAVSLAYDSTHWGSLPMANFTGTEPVAGTDIVYQSGWWYRVNGVDTRERALPAPFGETYLGSDGEAAWFNLDGRGFDVLEQFRVFDREAPSGAYTSRLFITNNSGAPLDISVFHYLDADADADVNTTGNTLTPWLLTFNGVDTAGLYRGRGASAYQVAEWPTLRDKLNDLSLSNLDNSGVPFGPGDWAAAYQWDVLVPASGSAYPVGGVVVSSRVSPRVKGDLVPNGNPDVLVWNATFGAAIACDMRRTTCLDEHLVSSSERLPVGVDDFHAQLTQDVVLHDQITGQVFFRDPYGYEIPLTGASPLPLNWKVAATADFDFDGYPDILWRNTTTQKLVIWMMAGAAKTGTRVPSPDLAIDANWEVVGARDFNDDGFTDLLWYNATSGKIVIWTMDALTHRIAGAFTVPPNAGDNNWRVVATADFGKGASSTGTALARTPDLLWRNATSGKLVVWHMNFSGQRTSGLYMSPDSLGLDWVVVGPR